MPQPLAILFDMDGTLTQPMLDFPRIKAEMGIGHRPILEALSTMTADARDAAERILHRHEIEASEQSILNDGCHDLLQWLAHRSIRTAIVTRNSLRSAATVLARHGLSFAAVITRDDGLYKPDPAPLRLACERLGVKVNQAWMVGDGQYDIEAGNAAGMRTIWISHGQERPFAAEPADAIDRLCDLRPLVEQAAQYR